MATGAAKNSIREEYCPSHIEVEWKVSYERMQKSRDDALRSPVFKIGRQSYMLKWEQIEMYCAKLSLLRMGPFVIEQSSRGRFWCGLKRTDGDYVLYASGQLKSLENESFEEETSYDITLKTNVDRLYLTPDGCLTLFLRMNIKRPLVGVETCLHGTTRMTNSEKGNIRQEECSRHQHVEWNIFCGIEQGNSGILTSPVFKIGTHMYFFKLFVDISNFKIHLYRLGSSIDGSVADVRYWIGIKGRDGTYSHRNFSGKLDLSEELMLWTRVANHCFFPSGTETQYLTQDRRFTFFLRMNVDSTGADLCSHDVPHQIAPQASGNFREEQCSSHRHVEWEVGYKIPQDSAIKLTSTVFKIGTQVYFLKIHFDKDGDVFVKLYRLGCSLKGHASTPRCWVGLKRKDGTYHYTVYGLELDLREDFGLWTDLETLLYVSAIEVKELYLTQDSRLTFLFRIKTEPTGKQPCTHDSHDMQSPVTGRIREVGCSSHKEVEWDIDCEEMLDDTFFLKSPVFKIDTQMYVLVLHRDINCKYIFLLCRLGRFVDGPANSVRCWAGLKHPDGTYPFRNFSEKFDLHDDFELWTVVTQFENLLKLDNNALKYIKRLTFFFRMNVQPTGTETCTHGLIESYASSGEGSIEIQECPAHNHVLWDLTYEASKDACSSSSPVFKVGNQWYHLNVCYDSKEHVTLELYRSGYPVQGPAGSVRCLAGLKSGDGSYHHHTQRAEIDLREEFLLLTHVASFLFPCHSDLKRTHVTSDGRLTFWLQLLKVPQVKVEEETCVHGAVEMCQPGDGSIREKKDNLVEWHVGYEEPREYTYFSTSPVFKIGVQFYLLELCYETDGILALSLYRFGRSVEGPAGSVRCWAGLKRDSGMYHHKIEGVEFDITRDCELWKKVKILCYFRRYVLESQCLTKDGRLTFFFLVSAEGRESSGVVIQRNGNAKGGRHERFSQHSEDFKKLREDFRLWLEHPEEGDRIRRRRREEFEAKRGKVLDKELKEDKEPSIFAA